MYPNASLFTVLGTIAISDRDFIFCFANLFIYLFISERINTKKKGLLRSDFWPFGNSQLSWVDGCFDCFTARFHYGMKPIVYADYGSWKMCMNTLVAQIDKMFSFVRNINLAWNRTAQPNANNPMQKVYFSTLVGLGPRFLFKLSLFSSILKCAQK